MSKVELGLTLNPAESEFIKMGIDQILDDYNLVWELNDPLHGYFLNIMYRAITGENHPKYIESFEEICENSISLANQTLKDVKENPDSYVVTEEKIQLLEEALVVIERYLDNFRNGVVICDPKSGVSVMMGPLGERVINLSLTNSEAKLVLMGVESVLDSYHPYGELRDPIYGHLFNTVYRTFIGADHPMYAKNHQVFCEAVIGLADQALDEAAKDPEAYIGKEKEKELLEGLTKTVTGYLKNIKSSENNGLSNDGNRPRVKENEPGKE